MGWGAVDNNSIMFKLQLAVIWQHENDIDKIQETLMIASINQKLLALRADI